MPTKRASPRPPRTCALADQDCWGKCAADDIIEAVGRDQVKAVVDLVVTEVEGFFSLIRSDEALTFDNSLGRYAGVYNSKGYPAEKACSRDCSLVNGAAVAPYYCVTGVPADVVLSITKPPVIPGVAGTGGGCASEDTGRPTWIVFAWIQKIVGFPDDTTEELLKKHRPLIIHEIIHGLGFSNLKFRSATDSKGERKGLVTLGKVEDLDGATDEVWFFRKGRAYELAQSYFGCTSNGSWDGLPLMGLPELGRASHWETRIMRDEVMSYGRTMHAVSSITLAAMEDLGWYLANYSAAQCMSWGYQQGCDYVKTRCGRGSNDLSEDLKGGRGTKDDCRGGDWDKPNTYLSAKCEKGTNPCFQRSDNQEAPYNSAGGTCNAQCYTGADRDGCKAAPTSALETAGKGGLSDYLSSVSWEQFLFFGVWVLAALTFVGVLRKFLCPAPGSRRVLGGASIIFMLAGLATVVFNALALTKTDTIPEIELFGEQVAAFIGEAVMVVFLALGLVLFLVGTATLVGIQCRSDKTMAAVWVMWFLLLIVQVTLAVLLCWWVYVIEDVPNETLKQLQGKDDGRYEGELGAEALTNVEGFVCTLYQKCCRDPQLDLAAVIMEGSGEAGSGDGAQAVNRTCSGGRVHGVGSDVEVALQDPSNLQFCPYVTGSNHLFAPPAGICNPLDKVFPLRDCRDNFCLAGPEGYYNFLNKLVGFIKQYATGFGGLFACLVLVQLVLLVNLWNLRRRFKADQARKAEVRHSSEAGFQVMAGGSVLDPSGRPIGNVRSSQSKPRAGSVAAPGSKAMPKDDLRRNISL